MQSSNLLKYAKYIRNLSLCKYDTNFGYTTNWSVNTNVDGWDIYNDIYFYGCWNGVLFGSSYGKECFIQRTYQFLGLSAEDYYTINMMMRILPKEGYPAPKKGKIRWITANDTLWDSNKEMEFDLTDTIEWYMYIITAGESKWYQGDITNLRIYPFLDGHMGCKFELKYVRIEALDKYICNNTECSHYTVYSHPCPWTGSYGSCTAETRLETYTTASGISDSLIVDINDYGEEVITLGTNTELSGNEMAKLLASRINTIGLGGYYYASVEYTETGRLKISGGDVGSTVRITGGTATQALGFYDSFGFIGTIEDGTAPATGFDYASTRRLNSIELSQLIDGSDDLAYYHNPEQYSVEGGRADFFNSLTSNTRDHSGLSEFFYNIPAPGITIIDVTHPFNDSGKITDIYVNCSKIREDGAGVYIVRPQKNGSFRIIHTFTLSPEDPNYVWTSAHTSHHISCDALVSKGDVMAFYNADLHCVIAHASGKINARYFYYTGFPTTIFNPGTAVGNGVIGFSWYARSKYRQLSTILEIDFGKRVNVGTLSFTGAELSSYFDYNIACCLDMHWEVDLHNETHIHIITYCSTGYHTTVEHKNIAYGIECLSDGIRSPDGGRQGDSFGVGADGLITLGTHSYFYVNGDGEWDYQYECDGKHEFCYPYCGASNGSFGKDPISFILRFPEGVSEEVHKTAIYFKESKNFRHFSLSYYAGSERSRTTGDAIGYHYVPSFNSVELDGATITEENADGIDGNQQFKFYFFSNPTPWISPSWDAQAGSALDSFLNYHSVANLQWNLLAHNFDPVRCNGFKIFCDHHGSTKISEMELFVRTESKASLTDNAVLKVSDYGDRWRYVPFVVDPLYPSSILAKIDSSPRYAILDLNSQLPFKAFGLHVESSNSNVFDSCTNSFNMTGINPEGYSDTNVIELENVYGVPCNLTVSIDTDLISGDKTLSHIICHDQAGIDDAIVGPGGQLYKKADYPIYLGEGNVANNCKIYGLKNLIDGKEAYYLKNNLDIWNYWGTLHHGEAINFESQLNYAEVNFTFPEVVASFVRLDLTKGASNKFSYYINQIYAFYGGSFIEDAVFYLDANPGVDDHLGFETTCVSGILQPVVIFEDIFNRSEFRDIWGYIKTPTYRVLSELRSLNSKLYCYSIENGVTLEAFYTIPDGVGTWNYDIEFTLGQVYPLTTTIDFYAEYMDFDGNWFHRVTSLASDPYIRFYNSKESSVNVLNVTKTTITTPKEYVIKVSKRGFIDSFYINTFTAVTDNNQGAYNRLCKIRFVFYNSGTDTSERTDLYVTNVKITVFPEISYRSSIVIQLPSNQLDTIRFYTEDGSLTSLALYISDISGNFVYNTTNAETTDQLPVIANLAYIHRRGYDCLGNDVYTQRIYNRDHTYNAVYTDTGIDRWVGWDFGDCPKIINYLILRQQGPLYFMFQGSNEVPASFGDKVWATLLESTCDGTLAFAYLDVPNTTKYRYYRIVVPYIPENYSITWTASEHAYAIKYNSTSVTATVWNDPVRFYFAIDLGKRYNIDIVRHYGASSTHELGIGSTYIFYANTDTTDIDLVQWDSGNVYILIHFDSFIDSKLLESAKGFDVPVLGTFSIDNSISVFGWSGVFNGIDTVAYINDLGSLVFHNYDFTMEFRVWVHTFPTGTSEAVFVCKGKTATATRSFSIGVASSGYLFIRYLFDDNTSSVYNIYELIEATWYHIAVTRNGIYMHLFVDGVLVYSWRKNNVVYNTSDYIHLGAQHTNTGTYGSYFNGRMDEFRLLMFSCLWRGSFTVSPDPYLDTVASNKDTRWLKFKLDCSASITRINYLGVYPNTEIVFAPAGGLNCEWDFIGRELCDFSVGEYNIIKQYATISGSSTFNNSYATNVAVAYEEGMGLDNCWGFLSTDLNPSLHIELFEPKRINKIYIKHGTGNDSDGYYIKDYTIQAAPTTSGVFTNIVSMTNNTSYETLHEFSVTEVQVVKFIITDYVSGNITVYDAETIEGQVVPDLTPVVADGGFINEIRLLTSSEVFIITSENYPRICIDLEKQYNIVSKSVWAGPTIYPASYIPPWSSADAYFRYSSELTDNPSLISFITTPPSVAFFGTQQSFINYHDTQFVIGNSVWLLRGSYEIRWESLGATTTTKFKLVVASGPYVIEVFAVTVDSDWTVQSSIIHIEETGFYVLSVEEYLQYDDVNWGVRNIYIYSASGVSRWVQIEMNAATEYFYIWNGGSPYNDKSRALRKVFLFTDDRKIPPTQNSNWWISNVSSLSSDYINTLVDECSLDIQYPATTELDWVLFREADHFGIDRFWLEQDLLCFNFYIDNIDNMDTSIGGFGFGNVDGKYPFIADGYYSSENMTSKPVLPYKRGVYGWDMSRLSLHSGWNRVRLRFVDFNATVPITIPGVDEVSANLNLRNYVTTSFGIFYKGKGVPLNIKIENITVERNRFDTDVKFGKGVCIGYGEYMLVQAPGINLGQGSLELTMSMYSDSSGIDFFGVPVSRTILTMSNSNNDLLSLGITGGSWFEIAFGNSLKMLNKFGVMGDQSVIESAYIGYGEPFHLGLAWSNDSSAFDNGDTIRLYLNGRLIVNWKDTWEFDDYRVPSLILGGGTCATALGNNADGSAIFEIIKLYNYCKDNFDPGESLLEIPEKDDPNDYIYISKNNVDFCSRYDLDLPFSFIQVQPGEKVPIYIKSFKDAKGGNLSSLTGEIIVEWEVAV